MCIRDSTNTAQNGNRLRKRDGSCLDGNNTANNPNCDGTQQGKQNSFQNTKDTNTAQNGNRLRKKDGSCLDGNNTVNNPNGNGNGMRDVYKRQLLNTLTFVPH